MTQAPERNRVREFRTQHGLTQSDLASRAGVSRTAITAIEGARLVPSVSAALAIARVLGTTVEELFAARSEASTERWAWPATASAVGAWSTEINRVPVRYPATTQPLETPLPDGILDGEGRPGPTLVLAGCDPAAGWLASLFQERTGVRLLVFPRSSQESIRLLGQGLVHMAGLHLATHDDPNRNRIFVRETLGPGYSLVRLARWQDGIAVSRSVKVTSIESVRRSRWTWVGRDAGSGARQCQDRVLAGRPVPRYTARHHRGVADAIQSGWADAGICVQLVCEEAGLQFLAIQEECYDLCVPTSLESDRRFQAFLEVIRSTPYRRLLGQLPGYSLVESGEIDRIV